MTLARRWLLSVVLVLLAVGITIWWRFSADLAAAQIKAALGSTVIETSCGLIEYQEAGTGTPILAVHGSGGGFDQGMALAAPLVAKGIRVIAMSRFGYLRTPMPFDGSAMAQADAFVCLMDALDLPTAAVLATPRNLVATASPMIRSWAIPHASPNPKSPHINKAARG